MTEVKRSRESAMIVLRRDAVGTPTVWCDPEIADLVDALNNGGLSTVASCSGHGHRPGRISLRDGRELFVVRGYDDAAAIDALFPVDINGEVRAVAQPNPSLSAQDANNERMREALEPFAERVDREMVNDLDRRRVSTLAKCGLLLMPKRGKGTELYAEILMALGVEDADCSDLIALEEARDHPEGHTLADRFAALSLTSEKDIRNDG